MRRLRIFLVLIGGFFIAQTALAVPCAQQFGRFLHEPAHAEVLNARSNYPRKLSNKRIKEINETAEAGLDRLGIAWRAAPTKEKPPSILTSKNDDLSNSRIPRGALKVYEAVSSPPGSGMASVLTKALEHPEFGAKLREMRERGYKLYVDPSLDLNKGGGTAAYFSPAEKSITLKPGSPWSVFLHEYEHLEFNERIMKPVRELGFFRERDEYLARVNRLAEMLNGWRNVRTLESKAFGKFMDYLAQQPGFAEAGDPMAKKAVELFKLIPTELGVNESLATQRALDAFEKEGFTLVNQPLMLHERMYQLEHQIQALEKVKRSAEQEAHYHSLVAAYQALSIAATPPLPAHRKFLEFVGKYGWPFSGYAVYEVYRQEKNKKELVITDGEKVLKVDLPKAP